jgi:predicted ATPase/DNA-binding SARP family transcriptional activator
MRAAGGLDSGRSGAAGEWVAAERGPGAMVLSVRLLGGVQALVDAAPASLGGPLQRGVLALLALAPEAVAAEEIVAGLWGKEPPPAARETLRAYISRLRAGIGAAHLARTPTGYRLTADDVDVDTFTHLARAGREALDAGDLATASAQLREALSLWHGEALADVRHLPFATVAAARLDESRLQATEDVLDATLRAGAHGEILSDLHALVTAAPMRERATGLLMVSLYRSGRQADALAAYTRLRTRLIDELGIEPGPEVQSLHQRVLTQDPTLLHAGAGAPHDGPAGVRAPLPLAGGNLPTPLTSFVGRSRELRAARELLDAVRLVTFTGAGGSGKTRLALELARSEGDAYVDGPWFVDLAGLEEGDLVGGAVASALGLSAGSGDAPVEMLSTALRGRAVLLVVDSCEHVVDDAAVLVEALLQRCPALRVVTTSREPLGVAGERVVVVPPLAVSDPDSPPDAVLLFADRARQVDPSFAVTDRNRSLVQRICKELDGIPLAIELAAARLQILSLEQIADMLDDRFALLTSGSRTVLPRHRTLMAAVAWSYDLLDGSERRLFGSMSVFRNGFTLDGLHAVAGRPGTLDGLGQLVAKSMVTVDNSTPTRRYRLLETLREFADRQLPIEERTTLADAHGRWCADLADEAERHLRTEADEPWWERLRAEQHNMRAAIRHALERGQHEIALRIVSSLAWYWFRQGPVGEGRQWLSAVLDLTGDAPDLLRARAHLGRAMLSYLAGDAVHAREDLNRSAELNADGADPAVRAIVEIYLSYFEAAFGDADAAQRRMVTARRLAAAAPPWVHPEVCMTLGQLARARGKLREADELLLAGRKMALAAGHRWCASSCGWIAAKARLDAGRPAHAAALLGPVIVELAAAGDRTSLLAGLHTMAAIGAALGRSEDGAMLLGAVDAIGERIGYSPVRMDPIDAERHRALVRQRLSPAVAVEALRRGGELTLPDAARLGVQIAREATAGVVGVR